MWTVVCVMWPITGQGSLEWVVAAVTTDLMTACPGACEWNCDVLFTTTKYVIVDLLTN